MDAGVLHGWTHCRITAVHHRSLIIDVTSLTAARCALARAAHITTSNLVHFARTGVCELQCEQSCCNTRVQNYSDCSYSSLRPADVPTCVVPRTLSSYGDRTFAAAGPRQWNSLPVQLRNPDITYGLFRRQLKGHFFREA